MADGGRYSGMSHRELYDQLFAGKPNDVENTVAAWKSAERQADTLAGAVDSDLNRVVAGWEGTAGTEFRDRVGKISAYSRQLSGNFLATHTGLSQMSSALSEAQAKAETPEEHDDHDKMLSGALDGAAKGSMFGPVGTASGLVLGGVFGHNKDEEEKENARQRMAALVAGVATQYEVADQGDWRPIDPPPPGLPEGDPNLRSDPDSAPRVGKPALDHGTGPGGTERTGTIGTPAHVSADPTVAGGPPTTGDGTVSNGTHMSGTELLGAGDGGLAAGALAVGTAGGLSQLGNLAGGGGLTGTNLTSSTLPPGGVLGQGGAGKPNPGGVSKLPNSNGTSGGVRNINPTGTQAATSSTSKTSSTVKPGQTSGQSATGSRNAGTSTTSASNKPATGQGGKSGSSSAARSGGRGGQSTAMGGEARNAATSRGQAAAGGARGQAHDDEPDEHSTWLTEDDLVWRNADDVPPPVLGGA